MGRNERRVDAQHLRRHNAWIRSSNRACLPPGAEIGGHPDGLLVDHVDRPFPKDGRADRSARPCRASPRRSQTGPGRTPRPVDRRRRPRPSSRPGPDRTSTENSGMQDRSRRASFPVSPRRSTGSKTKPNGIAFPGTYRWPNELGTETCSPMSFGYIRIIGKVDRRVQSKYTVLP